MLANQDVSNVKNSQAVGVNPADWGLSGKKIREFEKKIKTLFGKFYYCFQTKTWNNDKYAYDYLTAMLVMQKNRHFKGIAKVTIGMNDDGQRIQHFMSDSPWDAKLVFDEIRRQVIATRPLRGGVLVIDETCEARYGLHSAGCARQYNGRLGKTDVCQVGVVAVYCKENGRVAVDAEMFLPKLWFDADLKQKWEKLNIPQTRQFKTKPEIALEMILRAKSDKLPFTAVAFDDAYGKSRSLRSSLDANGITYIADIPNNTKVYLNKPDLQPSVTQSCKIGRPRKRPVVVNSEVPVKVSGITDIKYRKLKVRTGERGVVYYNCGFRRVWIIDKERQISEQTLLIVKDYNGRDAYCLSNATETASLLKLARWKSSRYFVERAFQDLKSELGYCELEARKYSAWLHHTALMALGLWFMTVIKLNWHNGLVCKAALLKEYNIYSLPALSVSNIRQLLRSVLHPPTETQKRSLKLVTEALHLRSLSTKSRQKSQHANTKPTKKQTG